MKDGPSRRDFLGGAAAAALLPFCGGEVDGRVSEDGGPLDAGTLPDAGPGAADAGDAGTDPVDAGAVDAGPLDAGPTPQCAETEDNILGPFYRSGAPLRDVLDAAGTMTISGQVRGPDCAPLAGALLDVWQCDTGGVYDNSSSEYHWRGRFYADAGGRYSLRSVLPGRYLNGPTYRPRHIHFKVSAAGHVPLTTQLYFRGDPFLASDPFVRPSLVIDLPESGGAWSGTFHIVLAAQ